MKLWLDAHLSPALADWFHKKCVDVLCSAVRDLGLRDATDAEIFAAGREAGAVIVTKDSDFLLLLGQHGAPPQILWLTCGNTSNVHLQQILGAAWPAAEQLLRAGEPLVEIGGLENPTR